MGRKLGKKMIKGLIVGTARADAWVLRLRQETDAERKIQQCACLNEGKMRQILEDWGEAPQDCFCVVETDEAARAAVQLGVPCIAYCNPHLQKQEFFGVDLLLEGFEEIDWPFLENVHTRELGLPVTIAETEHLRIREMVPEDLDVLYELYEDPQIRRFVKDLDEDRAAEEERVRSYIRYMYGLYQFGMWVLEDKRSGAVIGRAGFGIADYREQSELDLGYLLGKAWRGRGWATEACRAVLEYGRTVLGFSEVAAFVHPDNAPSLAVLHRLGFRKEGEIESETEPLLYYRKILE